MANIINLGGGGGGTATVNEASIRAALGITEDVEWNDIIDTVTVSSISSANLRRLRLRSIDGTLIDFTVPASIPAGTFTGIAVEGSVLTITPAEGDDIVVDLATSVTSAVSAAISQHETLGDPHTQYFRRGDVAAPANYVQRRIAPAVALADDGVATAHSITFTKNPFTVQGKMFVRLRNEGNNSITNTSGFAAADLELLPINTTLTAGTDVRTHQGLTVVYGRAENAGALSVILIRTANPLVWWIATVGGQLGQYDIEGVYEESADLSGLQFEEVFTANVDVTATNTLISIPNTTFDLQGEPSSNILGVQISPQFTHLVEARYLQNASVPHHVTAADAAGSQLHFSIRGVLGFSLGIQAVGSNNLVFVAYNSTATDPMPLRIYRVKGVGTVQNTLLYTEQTLTEEQKEQARTNIGAGTGSGSGGTSGNLQVAADEVWTSTSHTPLLITATPFSNAFDNEIPDTDPLGYVPSNAVSDFTLTQYHALPERLTDAFRFTTGSHDSVLFRSSRAFPDRFLLCLTINPTVLGAAGTRRAIIDSQYWGVYIVDNDFLRLSLGTTSIDLSHSAQQTRETRVAVYIERTTTGWRVRTATNYDNIARTYSLGSLANEPELLFSIGASYEGFTETPFGGTIKNIVVAEPHSNLTGTELLNLATTTEPYYGFLSRRAIHTRDDAVPHGTQFERVRTSGLSAGQMDAEWAITPIEDNGVLADFVEVHLESAAPSGVIADIVRYVGATGYLEGFFNDGRRIFTKGQFDGDTLRLRIRNGGAVTITGFTARAQGYVTEQTGVSVFVLENVTLNAGQYYWFDRHYRVEDIARVSGRFITGQRGFFTLNRPTVDMAVYAENAVTGTDGRGGDLQFYGWSGDTPGFRIADGGGTYNPPSTRRVNVRFVRRSNAQSGMVGGLYVASVSGSGAPLTYLKFDFKDGVVV